MIDRSSLRIAARTLGRHAGFTTVAILSIAVAIALNTTMYSLMDAMLDPNISARRPEQIYGFVYYGNRGKRLTMHDFENALSSSVPAFGGVTGSRRYEKSLDPVAENGSRYARVQPIIVRGNYFDFLGTLPEQGRTFAAIDEGTTNVVISDRLSRKLFPDESPVGRGLLLDGNGFTVVGVVRRNATFAPLQGDLWLLPDSGSVPLTLMRITERIEPTALFEKLKDVAQRLALAAGEAPGTTAFRGKGFVTRHFVLASFHYALIGSVVAVLLVACANLANLQLARGLARTRELALRSAVGASRRQLVVHLLLETAVLAAAGLALGIVLTLWGVSILRTSIPPEIEGYIIQPQTSWRMFAVASGAALVCLFLVGLLPALQISRVDPDSLLKSGQGTGANRPHRQRYGIMVAAQIGFALPVLIGAVVMFRTAFRINGDEWLTRELYGFNPNPIVAAYVPLRFEPANPALPMMAVAADLTNRARSINGVVDAAADFTKAPMGKMVTVDDENGQLREEMAHLWNYHIVSPSYFRTMGRQMERGRDFQDGEFDGQGVIIDAPTARFLWGAHDPLGRAIKFGDRNANAPFHRVIGVVGDLRDTFAIRRRDPTANFRLKQVFRVITPTDTIRPRMSAMAGTLRVATVQQALAYLSSSVTVYARTHANAELTALRVQRSLRGIRSGGQSAAAAPLVDEYGVSRWRASQDFATSMFATFAMLGIALAALGVFGIVSHSVAERRRELAVRISLGATARDVLRSVLREGNAIVLAGLAIGLFLTKSTIWWLMHFMMENEGYNAPLFALIAAGLFVLAVGAAIVPAMRATAIDPAEALRHD